MQLEHLRAVVYILSSVAFIIGLKQLSHPRSARRGNLVAAAGMLLAIVATMALPGSEGRQLGNIGLILAAMALGTLIGWMSARRVPMTAMPQMVSLFNGMGGDCAAAIALLEMVHAAEYLPRLEPAAASMIVASAIIGSVSLSGSLVAFAKLQGILERSLRFRGQNVANSAIAAAALVLGGIVVAQGQANPTLLAGSVALALLYGIAFVVPIGGADMPVVISFLNSWHRCRCCVRWTLLSQSRHAHRWDCRRGCWDAPDAADGACDEPLGAECALFTLRRNCYRTRRCFAPHDAEHHPG